MQEFGEKVPGALYTVRRAAYGICRNEQGEIAVVAAKRGLFLPGGGIEGAETPEECVRREFVEELGWEIGVKAHIGRAVQHFYAASRDRYIANDSEFYLVQYSGQVKEPVEPDHVLHWLTLEEAVQQLSHENQSWAVQQVKNKQL